MTTTAATATLKDKQKEAVSRETKKTREADGSKKQWLDMMGRDGKERGRPPAPGRNRAGEPGRWDLNGEGKNDR